MSKPPTVFLRWTAVIPVIALVAAVGSWDRDLSAPVATVVAALLAGGVLAAVHHAEVVAHRVGEPFGSLILAVAVTIIEVALIVTLMISGGEGTATLARDTVFAAVMICCNGILGICLLVGALRRRVAAFNADGTGAALAAIATVATLCMVLPTFTTGQAGPEFTGPQLAFAAVASLTVYLLFVGTQTIRHRDYFLPVSAEEEVTDEAHADPPSTRTAVISLLLLVVALVAVVGNAKSVSPFIEAGVAAAGMPRPVVGIIIALLVLLPEGIAAVRAARRNQVQTSLNLALGSAMASIGLTIPAVAVASIFLAGPLILGLGPVEIVLLTLTIVVGTLTVVPGRATPLQDGVHLALFAAFLFLAASP